MMQVLVTGGGGFLGRYIVEQLLEKDVRVRIFSRGKYDELTKAGVDVVSGDIRDAKAVESTCENIDAVFHTAAVPGIWGAWETFHSINTQGTLNLINACRHHNVKKLVYTSSPSVVYDGKPHLLADESLPYPKSFQCHYPHSKALAEQAVLAANDESLSTVAIRPHLIWGPRDNHLIPRLIQRAKTGKIIRVGDGANEVSCAYVENVAAAHLQVLEQLHPESPVAGQAYFINEPEPVNLWNWIDDLLALGELPPVQRSIPATAARLIGAAVEGVYKTFRWQSEPRMTRFLASQFSQSHSYSIEKARRDFDYQPIVSFEEGMQKLQPEIAQLVKPSSS